MYECRGNIPVLEGARLRLRPLREQDAADMFSCWSDDEVRRYADLPPMEDLEDVTELIVLLNKLATTDDSLRWAIEKKDGTLIGSCGYNWWQLDGAYRGELGCELSKLYWGQGYMKEALELGIQYGFEAMGLNRIEALADPRNERAHRLFLSLGFVSEGCLRDYRHTASGFVDAAVYSLLRREWNDIFTGRK